MNNAGFLSVESVRENQLANLSKQIEEKDKEIETLNANIEIYEELLDKQNKTIAKLTEELKIEKGINKDLMSIGADIENKLYEEQDKNKRAIVFLKEQTSYDEEDENCYWDLDIPDCMKLLNILERGDR